MKEKQRFPSKVKDAFRSISEDYEKPRPKQELKGLGIGTTIFMLVIAVVITIRDGFSGQTFLSIGGMAMAIWLAILILWFVDQHRERKEIATKVAQIDETSN